jgi:hypothetical protein
MTNQEARALYQQGEEVTVAYLVEITNRLKAIEARLNLNSQNSSKPPSTDQKKINKNRSLRKKSGRKPGGQPGHQGKTLEKVDNPDEVILHRPEVCLHCQTKLQGVEANGYFARQVFEIPEPKIIVIALSVSPALAVQKRQKQTFQMGWSKPFNMAHASWGLLPI